MRTLWIAQLDAAEGCISKIPGRHQLGLDELDDALRCAPKLPFTRDLSPDRGPRYLVWVKIRGLKVRVVLRCTGEDCYRIITAFVDD